MLFHLNFILSRPDFKELQLNLFLTQLSNFMSFLEWVIASLIFWESLYNQLRYPKVLMHIHTLEQWQHSHDFSVNQYHAEKNTQIVMFLTAVTRNKFPALLN